MTRLFRKKETLSKPINFLYCQLGHPFDPLYFKSLFPSACSSTVFKRVCIYFWLISGPLSQALYKLVCFLAQVFASVSFQSLVLIAVDRHGVVVIPFAVHYLPLFHSRHLDSRNRILHSIFPASSLELLKLEADCFVAIFSVKCSKNLPSTAYYISLSRIKD